MTKTHKATPQWNIVQTSGNENWGEVEDGLIDSSIKGKSKRILEERKGQEIHQNEEGAYGKLYGGQDLVPTLLEVYD